MSFTKIFLIFSLLVTAATAQSVRVEGVVHDSTGASVAGAQVEVHAGIFSSSHDTDAQGNFVFDSIPASTGTLTVQAKGFGDVQQKWDAGSNGTAKLEISLSPASVSEQVFVTATRTEVRLSDVAVSSVALSTGDLNATPALTVDDKLRQIPGFTLFRRSGSRTANPTSQGVSLSGLGASGASRAIVMEDGVPLADPFGAWVYWGRVPQAGLQSVEVVRRGISSLYGSEGLAGAIQFIPKPVNESAFTLETSYGNEQTPDLSFWGGTRIGAWDTAISTDLMRTDGYILVPKDIRGSVDNLANAEHGAVEFTLGRRIGQRSRVFGRATYFTESRNNGTVV